MPRSLEGKNQPAARLCWRYLTPARRALASVERPACAGAARLRRRVPANRMADFLDKWIPMEDAYFEHFNVRENSDLALVSKDEKPGSE